MGFTVEKGSGNFKITPLKINFDEIFWHHFLPRRLPAVASLHSMLQNYPDN